MTPAKQGRPPPGLYVYIAAVGACAAGIAYTLRYAAPVAPSEPAWAAFPLLVGLLVAAEYLVIQFRYGTEINGLNLNEAILAPMLFAFPAAPVILAAAVAQLLILFLRRNGMIATAFNIAQWALATGSGAYLLQRLYPEPGITIPTLGALLVVLAVVGLVNQLAFTGVMLIASRRPPLQVLKGLASVIIPGWLLNWVVNSLFGLLFVLAFAAHPAAVGLFAVPLIVLHFAYRGYVAARSDRVRLAGLHRAAAVLAQPLDPTDAIEPFLRAVAESFEARAASIVLRTDTGRLIHTVQHLGPYTIVEEDEEVHSLESVLLEHAEPVRLYRSKGPMASVLAHAGCGNCLAAPMLDDGKVIGAIIVVDQSSFGGFETGGLKGGAAGELSVIEAIARETAATFAKGHLLAAILEERRKLQEIVSSSSDGIFTVSIDGTVRSWNPAMERITGIHAVDIVDRAGGAGALAPTTLSGVEVRLAEWASGAELPADIRVTDTSGRDHRLACTYSTVVDSDGPAETLVVVARDVTSHEEIAELRQEFDRLAEERAVQRTIVDQLQEAVMPVRPTVRGTDLAVHYIASESEAPTGGDLYDWQVLPSGEVHVAVVDVLGHGVSATKDALTVIHALRLLALQNCPLDEIVERADGLLGAHNPDLVATVIVGRYNPVTGRCRLASGGHPPALHISQAGGVRQLAASGGAIGWPGAGSELIAVVDLAPEDALVFYTDGLVEARKNILEGTETLMRHAQALMHLPAEQLAEELVHRSLEGAERRDDALALILKRAPAAQRQRWQIPPNPLEVRLARRGLTAWLGKREVPAELVDDVQLIAAELLSNACAVAQHEIDLRVILEGSTITVEVEDDGPGRYDLNTLGTSLPSDDALSGRGLYIVHSLADNVEITSTPEGTVVQVVVRGDRGRGDEERAREAHGSVHGSYDADGRRSASGER